MSEPDHVLPRASRAPAASSRAAAVTPGASFARLAPPLSRSALLVERLSRDIIDGTLLAGSRLPTEPQLGAAFGVSRTVVREAMAALRGDGLVIARQGAGVFVADHVARRSFRIDAKALESVTNVLLLMELRTGVESEAAALAAERRDNDDIERLDAALAALEAAIGSAEGGSEADADFHRAVMRATHNAYFIDFHRYIGQFVVGGGVRAMVLPPAERVQHLRRVRAEHQAIRDAIAGRRQAAARSAAQRHLRNSRRRYGRLREALEREAASGS